MWMHIFSRALITDNTQNMLYTYCCLLCTTQKLIKQQIHIGMSGSVFLLYVPLL